MRTIDGISAKEAAGKFWLIDKYGLITDGLREKGLVREDLDDFVRSASEFDSSSISYTTYDGVEVPKVDLLQVVKAVKPTVLIGCSTHAGGFTQVLKAMKKNCERPIVFPLSNPSKLVEVDPKDANDWTDGMALIATGSPFPPVKSPKGKDYEYVILFFLIALLIERQDCRMQQ